MKIFIICCILFIHVNMYVSCICLQKVLIALTTLPYKAGFGYPIGFWGSIGLVMGMDYHLNRCSGWFRVSSSGFGFGCTGLHLIRIHPVAIPTHFLRGADGLWALNPSRMFLFFNYICCGGIFTFYTSRLRMNSANYHVSTQKYTLV